MSRNPGAGAPTGPTRRLPLSNSTRRALISPSAGWLRAGGRGPVRRCASALQPAAAASEFPRHCSSTLNTGLGWAFACALSTYGPQRQQHAPCSTP